MRNLFTPVVAIGAGILGGYYTFQPLLKDLQNEKRTTSGPGTKIGSQSPPATQEIQTLEPNSGSNLTPGENAKDNKSGN
ncbi:hypothetical protein BJX99DRAFT_259897 [Aspergillus californicus]